MPSLSVSQRRAAAIAEHHPEQAKGAAKEMAKSMTKSQLHDYATTPEKNLPEHVEKKSAEQQVFEKLSRAIAWRQEKLVKVAQEMVQASPAKSE